MSWKGWIIILSTAFVVAFLIFERNRLFKFGEKPLESSRETGWEEQRFEEIFPSASPSQPSKPSKINFSQTGNLVKTENGAWALLYEEPGNPALRVKLVFTPQSVCDFEKGGRCDQSLFTLGQRVKIEGEKTDDEVIVAGMTKLLSQTPLLHRRWSSAAS